MVLYMFYLEIFSDLLTQFTYFSMQSTSKHLETDCSVVSNIHITLDGTMPTRSDKMYVVLIIINTPGTTVVKAIMT
jgi:hypothetical protein